MSATLMRASHQCEGGPPPLSDCMEDPPTEEEEPLKNLFLTFLCLKIKTFVWFKLDSPGEFMR